MILSYLRTILLYLVLIFSIRLMGKRQIGQMEASEFVVTMLVVLILPFYTSTNITKREACGPLFLIYAGE